MSRLTRKIIMIAFVIIFCVVSPLLMLYAFGYQLNWQAGNWQRTGMFVIKTEPANARIYIDGKLQTSWWPSILGQANAPITTPNKIKGIFPGEYQVRLELDGYRAWEKRLTVRSNESVFIEDVRFFSNSLPWQITSLDIDNLSLAVIAPNEQQQAILLNQELLLIDLKESTMVSWQKYSNNNLPTIISWSPNSQHLLTDQTILTKPSTEQTATVVELNSLLEKGYANPKWLNNDHVYYLADAGIYSFDLNKSTSDLLYPVAQATTVSDYVIKDNKLYLIIKNAGHSSLVVSHLDNSPKQILDLPLSGQYSFLSTDSSWLNIYNQQSNILYLVDPNNLVLDKMQSLACICYQWLDNNQLLYADDFEIWLWDVVANKKRLLTRVSDKITQVLWHPSNNYIIYSTNKQINSLELDDRDRHLVNTLTDVTDAKHLIMSVDGQALYFYATIGQQSGLYQLDI